MYLRRSITILTQLFETDRPLHFSAQSSEALVSLVTHLQLEGFTDCIADPLASPPRALQQILGNLNRNFLQASHTSILYQHHTPAFYNRGTVIEERRQYQRLNITRPVDGWFGDFSVMVVEVSADGAKIVHDEPLPVGSRGLLRFTWRGEDLEFTVEIAQSDGARSGVHLLEDSPLLRRLIVDSGTELLRAQEANASGDRARNVVGDGTLTAASAGARDRGGFLEYRFADGNWKCRRVLLPDQPEDGFTVSANETQDQIDLLCTTWASGDGEARRMTRMIAEASLTR